MLSDIEIIKQSKMKKIVSLIDKYDIKPEEVSLYGENIAKLDLSVLDRLKDKKDGKLILVTAINPTPAGEGKTTTTIGLADGLRKIGKKSILALREPSLGPVFGIKGGATGGGHAQVAPMEDINLHFTGDFHAIGAANNLLAAMIDNHIHHGNALGIDTRKITWKRCVDMNDRQLRNIIDGLGGKSEAAKVAGAGQYSGANLGFVDRLDRMDAANTLNRPTHASSVEGYDNGLAKYIDFEA